MASITLPPAEVGMIGRVRETQCAKIVPPPASTSLAGQTVIITGSNVGIGLDCARQMLDLNLSHLIMAVRRPDNAEEAAAPLRQAHPKARIEVWHLDMLSYDSIQAFARQCATLERLDVAILNAGVTKASFEINSSTRHEEIFQVNYLSTALLAILLLPILKNKSPAGTPGRLALVSSGLGLQAEFPNRNAVPLIPSFDDATGWGISMAGDRYNITKLLLYMFVLKISECVSAEDVVVNAVCPGFTKGSGLHRHLPVAARAVFGVLKTVIARPLETGAWAYLDAVLVKGKESHGSFVMNQQIHA
ncbi:short-chain dehydrogenase [Polyplosphaeria fusca]|uniref:Short-chain dehydrogenase n=1 Tax=Polyplosphaeria fusca TaxID=682080 RepID=A0A9P4QPI0_9PLEO|nr:short-chain dehydrogenase [Polyplosphaeria fusca]